MRMPNKGAIALISRGLIALFSLGVVFCFGAGYAYSGMRGSDRSMIRIAYANGYKDALEYVFKVDADKIDQLKNDRARFKSHVLYEADSYVNKVARLN